MPTSSPSSPASTPDTTATATLTVRTRDALDEVVVFDGHLNERTRGVGGLVAKLPTGLYKIRVRTGPLLQERLVALEQDATEVFEPADSGAPVIKVLSAGSAPLRTVDRGQGSVLTIWIKDPPPGNVDFDRRAARALYVSDDKGQPLADVDVDGQPSPDDPAMFICRIRSSPGLKRLKFVLPTGKAIERGVVTAMGWDVDVRVERQQYLRSPAIDLAGGTVQMRPGGAPPNEEFERLTETALYALANGRRVMSDRMNALLKDKFENPMFGLIGAHLVLRDVGAKADVLPVVLQNTGYLIGEDDPDLKALRLKMQPRPANSVVFDVPPMLRMSWDLIVEGTFDGTAEIDPRSCAGAICEVEQGLLLRHARGALDARDVVDDAMSLRTGIRDVVTDFVKQVRTQVSASLGTDAPRDMTLGVPDRSADISFRGVPSTSGAVGDLLQHIDVLDAESKAELGRTLGVPRNLLDAMLQKLTS